MRAIIGLVLNLYFMSITISTGIQILKNYISDRKIEKQGYKIINDNTISESISDFIFEYSYIFIPITNLKKSFKLLLTSNKKYTKKRIEELQKEKRLKKITNEKPINKEIPAKQETLVKKEIKKPEVIQIKEKEYDITKPFKEEIKNSDDIYFLEALKKEYKDKSNELRKKYNIILQKYKTTTSTETKKMLKQELNSIVSKVKIFDEIFITARDRIVELKRKQTTMKQTK